MTEGPERHINTEYEVVVSCARSTIGEAEEQRLRRTLGQPVDWHRVLYLARFHNVYPLVHKTLSTLSDIEVPSEVMGELRQRHMLTAATNLRKIQELGRITDLLHAVGVRLVSFKGPTLAHEAYRSLALRPCTDLDILIEKSKFRTVQEILLEDGYLPAIHRELNSLSQRAHLFLSQQVPFVRDRTHSLDVHASLMPPGYEYSFGFRELYDRTLTISIGNREIRTFNREDLLLILCFHGLKNRWERLKHVCDVAELIRATPELDWDVVVRRARQTNGEGILHLGLLLSTMLMDAPVPEELAARVREDERAAKFGKRLLERLPDNLEAGMVEFRERLKLYLGIQDTFANKLRYSAYSLLRRMEQSPS